MSCQLAGLMTLTIQCSQEDDQQAGAIGKSHRHIIELVHANEWLRDRLVPGRGVWYDSVIRFGARGQAACPLTA
jgi:hypothetical protein